MVTAWSWRSADAASLNAVRRRDELYSWFRRHRLVVDGVLALGLFVVLIYLPFGFGANAPPIMLLVVMCAALAFRRVRPVASFAVVAGCGLLQWAVGWDLSSYDTALLVSLFALAAYGPRWASRAGLAVGLLGVVLAVTRYFWTGGETALGTAVMLGALVVATWAVGDVRRTRHDYVQALVDRAEQAERERDQQAALAAVEERGRIAREMHDVVAHSLSVMVVQADGGRYAADEHPDQATKALETIAGTGRQALVEMRRLLGVLRDDDGGAGLAPQPGVGMLPDLIRGVRESWGDGAGVRFAVHGDPRPLDDGPSLAVYRVIQEALTNVIKHAGQRVTVDVVLSYGDEDVEVRVEDDGRGAATLDDGAGGGLIGMRERVVAYGGTCTAGPRPGGGWRVEARMPYETRVGEALA